MIVHLRIIIEDVTHCLLKTGQPALSFVSLMSKPVLLMLSLLCWDSSSPLWLWQIPPIQHVEIRTCVPKPDLG